MTQQLPEGFVIDQPSTGLPEGFVIDEPVKASPTIGERARAVGDVAGAMVGGVAGEIAGGLSGLAAMPFVGAEKAAEIVGDVQALPAESIPRSELGQEYLSNIGEFFGKAAEKINPLWKNTVASLYGVIPGADTEEMLKALPGKGLGGDLGEVIYQVTGSEELAAIASAYPTAVMEIIGFKGARALKGDAPTSDVSQKPSVALAQATPDVDQLKTQARTLYKEIDDMGVKMNEEKFIDLSIGLRDKFNSMGMDRQLTPDSARIIERFDELVGQEITLSDLDMLRQLSDIPAKKFDNPREMALGNTAKEYIDDFIDAEGRRLASTGRVDVGEKIRNARNLWARGSKSDVLTEAMEKAKDQASGFENGLRVQFRQLLGNKKKMRGFSKAEKDAMQQVVQGSGVANTLRALGKFGIFGQGGQTTILPALIGGPTAAAFAGSPVVGVMVPVIGQVSKELALKMTQNNAKMAQGVVRAGSDGLEIAKAYVRNVPKNQRSVSDLTELLMRTEVDLDTITEMAGDFGTLANDAKYVAELLRDMGLTSLVAVPGATTGVQEATQE